MADLLPQLPSGALTRHVNFGGYESALEPKLAGHALDTVSRVDVLHACDLITGSRTLARDYSRIGEEVLPDLV